MTTVNGDGIAIYKLAGKNRLATALVQRKDDGGVWRIYDGEELVGDSTRQLEHVAVE